MADLVDLVHQACIGHGCTYLFDPRRPDGAGPVEVRHGSTCNTLRRHDWPVPPAGALAASLPHPPMPATVGPGLVDNVDTMAEAFGVHVVEPPPSNRCPDGLYRGCDFMGCDGLVRGAPTWPRCPHRPRLAADPRWPVLELVPGWRHLARVRPLILEAFRRTLRAVEALRSGANLDEPRG